MPYNDALSLECCSHFAVFLFPSPSFEIQTGEPFLTTSNKWNKPEMLYHIHVPIKNSVYWLAWLSGYSVSLCTKEGSQVLFLVMSTYLNCRFDPLQGTCGRQLNGCVSPTSMFLLLPSLFLSLLSTFSENH